MPVKTPRQILKRIASSYPYPFNFIIACSTGLYLGLTEEEREGLKSGRLKFKTKYENKKLLREMGATEHPEIPDFPWNKQNAN